MWIRDRNYAAAKAAVDALRSQQAAAQSSDPAQPPETLREAAAELTAARDAARGQEKQLAARLLPNRRIMEQYRTCLLYTSAELYFSIAQSPMDCTQFLHRMSFAPAICSFLQKVCSNFAKSAILKE